MSPADADDLLVHTLWRCDDRLRHGLHGRPSRLLVTSALPYANGPLHFGHVTGAYLPADVLVRLERLVAGLGPQSAKERWEADEAAGVARRVDRVEPAVLFVCGTDEHGVAITVNAEKEGVGYQEYVDRWHAEIAKLFGDFAISFDIFSRTSNREPHYRLSQEFFLRLLDGKHVQPHEEPQHYCTRCSRFLPDRYVIGTCYLCAAPDARGDECKRCGEWLDPIRLVEPRCLTCGSTPEIRQTMQYELELERAAELIRAGSQRRNPDLVPGQDVRADKALQDLGWRIAGWKQNVVTTVIHKQLTEGGGLTRRPITRDLPWGVPLPAVGLDGAEIAGHPGKTLYVWFDAPIGYISATIEWARDELGHAPEGADAAWRRYWIDRESADFPDDFRHPRLVHFIGKDNIVFHCVVFPTMLAFQAEQPDGAVMPLGSGDFAGQPLLGPRPKERWVLPANVPANEFYGLEGRKFSTSDGWTLDNARMFELFGVDALRWYLVRSMPETADSQFSFEGLGTTVNAELADVLGNYASRVLKFAHAQFGGVVPEPDPAAELPAEQAVEQALFEFFGSDSVVSEGHADREALSREGNLETVALAARLDALHVVSDRLQQAPSSETGWAGFRAASAAVVDFGRLGNRVFDAQAPWKLRKESGGTEPRSACASAIWGHIQWIATLSVLLTPFVPHAAARLRRMLNLRNTALPAGHPHEWLARAWTPTGLPGPDAQHPSVLATASADADRADITPQSLAAALAHPACTLPAGHRLGEPGILFAKIPPEVVAAEREALAARAAAR